jgi:hypothetical protein
MGRIATATGKVVLHVIDHKAGAQASAVRFLRVSDLSDVPQLLWCHPDSIILDY